MHLVARLQRLIGMGYDHLGPAQRAHEFRGVDALCLRLAEQVLNPRGRARLQAHGSVASVCARVPSGSSLFSRASGVR